MSDQPWWFPVLADHQWANRIRADYPEHTAGMDDDAIRDEYADGRKYADLWDHLGDARADYEKLADDYLQLVALLDRVRSECKVVHDDGQGETICRVVIFDGPPDLLRQFAERLGRG